MDTKSSTSLALWLLSISVGWTQALLLPGNLEQLRCAKPDQIFRFSGSRVPGQLFHLQDPVDLQFVFQKGDRAGAVDFTIEIQEIGTRTPGKVAKDRAGWTDTAGQAPIIDLIGAPVRYPLKVAFTDKQAAEFEVPNLPVPRRFGTFALVLNDGGQRVFLTSVARVPERRAGGTVEDTPIFGEGSFIQGDGHVAIYARMGIRGWRSEVNWNEKPNGECDWTTLDRLFGAAEANGLKIMLTLGGHPPHFRPFGEPTPAVGWTTNSGGYGGTGDWVCDPKYYARYGKWVTALCERYWKGGQGGLWGLEDYNEPWEGGGISGWARDAREYRALQKLIAESARKVSPNIRLLASSTIMNTEDKLYSDGSNEFDKYIDIFTDHYVVPVCCYGPMVAKAHGKQSMETETWFVNSEFLLPQGVAQFMAAGQARIAPWHPRVLFDNVPGGGDATLMPSPVVSATAAFNYFVTGKRFEKLVFQDHLPWVFQFGEDSDPDALLVLFGQLMNIGGEDPKGRLWMQVDAAPGGTLTVDNHDGLLRFFDLAGNPLYVGDQSVTLPMTTLPTYITCARGPVAAAARLKQAQIAGKRPVEILPRDFTTRVTARDAALQVGLHNCLNRPIRGTLTVATPAEITLAATTQTVELAAGEIRALRFAVASAKPHPQNAYPCRFRFSSDAGEAEWAEVMNAAIAPKRTITVDGNLEDWADLPGVSVVAGAQSVELGELLRRPWLDLKAQTPQGKLVEFKLAWDDEFLYVAARVNNPTPQPGGPAMAGRDEDRYFHSAASDTIEPYQAFLKQRPGRSFAEVPYVYRLNPENPGPTSGLPIIPFRRDRLQIALDVTDGWHDMVADTNRVPYGFHAVPDTDYEYALYLTDTGSELWRYLAPGVPRIHDWPRQVRGARTTGPVPGAKYVVKLDGNTYTYELAIPRTELADLNLRAGTSFGLMVCAGNQRGPNVNYAADKAVTKSNGLTLHPYWERSPNCGVRWTLVE